MNTFDLAELATSAGVTARTIRYYVQQGLLPSPPTRGPGTRYDQSHLDRLQLIKQLQRQHLPLAEIRRRLESLDDEAVRDLVVTTAEQRMPSSSALDYVREVLSSNPVAPAPAAVPAMLARSAIPGLSDAVPSTPTRSQWDRVVLAPDVELHVRRPLSREQNRRVERLLDSARLIFEEDA
jgi:DNA-binding transcriptional MerR regulator